MKRVALIVGVKHYHDDNIISLRYALHDATALHGLLLHKAGFDDAIFCPDPADPDEILDKAERLVSGLKAGDLFFFYFAGHGKSDDGRQLLLLPKVRLNRLVQHRQHTLEMSALRDCTTKEGVSRGFVIDACRSPLRRDRDASGQSFAGERGWRDILATSAHGSPIALMFSCAEGCQALEPPELGHGIFTHAFLEEVKAAVEAGAEIRLDDRFSIRLRERMMKVAETHELNREQRPWVQPGPGAEPPVLVPGRLPESAGLATEAREKVTPLTRTQLVWHYINPEFRQYLLAPRLAAPKSLNTGQTDSESDSRLAFYSTSLNHCHPVNL